jgi:hypothetical protein
MSFVLLSSLALAATFDTPVDPNATLWNGPGAAPTVIDLEALGITAGQVIELEQTGSMRFGGSLPSGEGALAGIFSASDVFLGQGTDLRVQDALDYVDAIDLEAVWPPIDQDFSISTVFFRPVPWPEPDRYSVTVTVPPGATDLFVGVHDNVYFDNVNEGLGIRVTYPDAPLMTVGGTCPGRVDFTFTGFTPNGAIELGAGSGAGDLVLPLSHPCGGANTGLSADGRLRATLTADGAGEASFSRTFNQAATCTTHMRVLDPATCALTPAVQTLP